jgi:hypothetical protein
MQSPPNSNRFPAIYSVAFLLAAALSFVMLVTDKNLQTDFGAVTSGYFVHWYLILGMGVIDVVGAGLLLLVRSRTMVKIGVVGSGLFAAALLGGIFTYAMVGFATPQEFANYLFGITYSGGNIRYLFDVLVATYLGTFVLGIVGLATTRARTEEGAPTRKGNGTSS